MSGGSAPHDPWLGESTYEGANYDPQSPKVWIASSDRLGHNTTVRVDWPGGGRAMVKVPEGIPGEIAHVVSLVPEFRTPQDFLRDILVRGIAYWRQRIPKLELTDWGRMVLASAELEALNERLSYEQDLVARLEKTIFNTATTPMSRQAALMQVRSALSFVEDEALHQRLRSILQQHPLMTFEDVSPDDFK